MVRKAQFIALFLLGFAGMCLGQDINGKWLGSMQRGDRTMALTFTFSVSGDSLSGTVEGPRGVMPISNGKVDGNMFSFDVTMGDMTMSHQCVLAGDSITVKAPGMQGDTMVIVLKRQTDMK